MSDEAQPDATPAPAERAEMKADEKVVLPTDPAEPLPDDSAPEDPTGEQAIELSAPFPTPMLRTHPKKRLTYVPISEVVARLNRVLGPGLWSYEVVNAWRDQTDEDWVIAHVRLTATVDGKTSSKDGFGGQQIKVYNNGDNKGRPIDVGDEYKGAASDGLKKAAQHFGIALNLARREEALAWERSEVGELTEPQKRKATAKKAAKKTAAAKRSGPKPTTDDPPLTDGMLKALKEAIEGLGDGDKRALREWFKASGLPKLERLSIPQAEAVAHHLGLGL